MKTLNIILLTFLCLVLCESVLAGPGPKRYPPPRPRPKPKGFMSIKPGHEPTIAYVLPKGGWVAGLYGLSFVSKNLHGLYAVVDSSVYMMYYHVVHGEHSLGREIKVEELSNPESLFASRDYDDRYRLYISESATGRVFMVEVADGSVSEWKLDPPQKQISALGRAQWTDILLSMGDNYDEILTYKKDGEFHKKTKINVKGLKAYEHSVHMPPDKYVVAGYRWAMDIFVIHHNGTLLKSYNEQTGPSDYRFRHPDFLEIDSDNNVLVVDQFYAVGQNKLILLTSSLKFVREIQPSGLYNFSPNRIYYDEKREVVYIGEARGRIVELKL